MGVLEMGLYIAPCVVEIFLQCLEYRRAHSFSSLVALGAFLCFTLGLLALVAVTSYREHPYYRAGWGVVRLSLGLGSILWLTSQFLWFRRKVTIVKEIP